MALLAVKFGQLDGVIRDLNTINDDYSDRIELLSDLKNSINGVENEFGYLDSASFQLSQKISQLEGYQREISDFRDKVIGFRDTAMEEETGLAQRLTSDSEAFMDAMGITPEYEKSTLEKLWEGFCEGVATIFNAIADFTIGVIEWVEENWDTIKQALIVVGEVLIAAAAIAAFILTLPASGVIGVLTAIGAGWAAFKACTDVVCDTAALCAYIDGDKETGDTLAEYDARHLFHDAGEGLNDLTGMDFFDDIADTTYLGLDVIQTLFPTSTEGMGSMGRWIDNMDTAGKLLKDIPDKGIWALTDIKDFSFLNGKDYDGAAKLVPDTLSEYLFGDKGKLNDGKTGLKLAINVSEFLDFKSPEYKDTKITKVLKDIKTLTGMDGKSEGKDILSGISVFGNILRGDTPMPMMPTMPFSPIAIGPIAVPGPVGPFGGVNGGGGFRIGGMSPIQIAPTLPSININIQFGPKGPIL